MNTITIKTKIKEKAVYGVATNDIECFRANHKHAYKVWEGMIRRCYSSNHQAYRLYGGNGITVCEEWLTASNFCKWFYENNIEGYHLDKDLLSSEDKAYGPTTCCFLPTALNSALTYKTRKSNSNNKLPIGVRAIGKRFSSTMCKKGKHIYIGMFDTPTEAANAYNEAKANYLLELANDYKFDISRKAYEALIKLADEV